MEDRQDHQRGFTFDSKLIADGSSVNSSQSAMQLTLPGPWSSSRQDATSIVQLQPSADDVQEATTLATTTSSAVLYQLSTGELVGVIVAASLVTACLIGVAIWLQWRSRRKRKGGATVTSQQHQVAIISLEAVKSTASRQNSASNGLGTSGAGYSNSAVVPEIGDPLDDEIFTEYGSIVGSFPPSPTLSFRSAIDAPGFNRSRAGTGTSFGTVASFSSYRSRLSNTASFHTCVEEDFI